VERTRWFGLVPASIGTVLIATTRPADVLISGDGRHVGLLAEDSHNLFVLRESRSDFARDNLTEIAGMSGTPILITAWPNARCSTDSCVVMVRRGGRDWRLLLTRSRAALPERALAAACERVDVVVSDRWLPRSCQPAWIKADRRSLGQTGGLAIDLHAGQITSVADGEGQHRWWRPVVDQGPRKPKHPIATDPAASRIQAAAQPDARR